MKSEKYEFRNESGETLAGRLEMPPKPTAYAIFAHCFTCSKNAKAASRISRRLAEQDIAVLRFDFTGLGNSEGDFSNTNFSSNVSDLVSAAESLRETHQAPQLLVGHSLGGTAVLMAASQVAEVRAVATIGSPADPEHVTHLFASEVAEIESQGQRSVILGGRQFTLKQQFVQDLRSIDMDSTLASLKKAVLVCHSPTDTMVGIEQARLIYERLKHPKSFLSVDSADHLLTDERDAGFVADMLASWAKRYLSLSEPASKPALEHGEVLVNEVQGFTQQVTTSDHQFFADEPVKVGGSNLGMTPYDLLLAALGSCTSMTIRMYANHKKWPLSEVSVRLAHRQIHATDCEDCESENGKISVISKAVTVSGDLSEEQVARLKEIADRCPVHRTIMNEKKVETSIVLA